MSNEEVSYKKVILEHENKQGKFRVELPLEFMYSAERERDYPTFGPFLTNLTNLFAGFVAGTGK